MSDKEKKLKWYTKIAYGFGEVGSQFSWGMISSYLTLFYTDVVGLAPSLISCIMIIARVWDAVNDPKYKYKVGKISSIHFVWLSSAGSF